MHETFPHKEPGERLAADHVNKLSDVARDTASGYDGPWGLGDGIHVGGLPPFVQQVWAVVNAKGCDTGDDTGDDGRLAEVSPRYYSFDDSEWKTDTDTAYCMDYTALGLSSSDIHDKDLYIAYFDPQRGHLVPVAALGSEGVTPGEEDCPCDFCAAGEDLPDATICCESWNVWYANIPPFGEVRITYAGNDTWICDEKENSCPDGQTVYRFDLVVTGTGPGEVTLTLTEVYSGDCETFKLVYTNCCVWHCQCNNLLTVKEFNFKGKYDTDDFPCQVCLSREPFNDIGTFEAGDCSTCLGMDGKPQLPLAMRMQVEIPDEALVSSGLAFWKYRNPNLDECSDGDPLGFAWFQLDVSNDVTLTGDMLPDGYPTIANKCVGWRSDKGPIAMVVSGTNYSPDTAVCYPFEGPQYGLALIRDAANPCRFKLHTYLPHFRLGLAGGYDAEYQTPWKSFDATTETPADIVDWLAGEHTLAYVAGSVACGAGYQGLPCNPQNVIVTVWGSPGAYDPTPPTASGDCGDADYGGGGGDEEIPCSGICQYEWTGGPYWDRPTSGSGDNCSPDVGCLGCGCNYTDERVLELLGPGEFDFQDKLLPCIC